MRQEQLRGGSNVPVCHGATYITSATFFHCPTTPPRRYYAHGRRRRGPPSQSLIWATAEEGKERAARRRRRPRERGRPRPRPTEGTHINLEKSFARQVVRRSQCAVQAITRSGVEWHEEAEEQIKCGTQKRLTKPFDDRAGFVESRFCRYPFGIHRPYRSFS